MAIKVKHEGSVASRLAASASGGSAKRAMEAAALAKPSQIQTLSPAHASAPSAAAPHAQLISAPGGGAHAPLIHGGGGIGATSHLGGGGGYRGGAATSAQSGGDGEYKVTGSSIFNRPDDASVWDSTTRQWVRRYLPGEKEAEIQQRVGDVKLEQAERAELSAQGRKERAALVNDVVNAIKQGKFSREEMPQLMEQFGIAEETLRMADSLRDKEPTPEESFRKNTFTDQNGLVFSRDGKLLYNPNDARLRQAEFAAKQLDALKARADKFELELMKPYEVREGEGDKAENVLKMRSDAKIRQIMKKHFPSLYEQDDTDDRDPIVVSPFDPLNPNNPATTPFNPGSAAQGAAPSAAEPPPAIAHTVEDAIKKWGVRQ